MAEELHKKIKLVRCKLGEFIKKVADFSKVDNLMKDSEVYLNLQISELSEEFKKVKDLHSEVSSNLLEDDEIVNLYEKENVFHTIESIYFKHSTTLIELLKIVNNSDKHDLTFSEFTQAAFQRTNFGSSQGQPNLDYSFPILNSITPFDGCYEKWPDFKDAFSSNVHENNSLNTGAKLKILQSLLKGDAAKIIKREFGSIKASDYDDLWERLNKRYNHKRSLVNSYFHVLFYQPVIEKETSEGLKKLYDTTVDTLLDLRRLGLQVDGWGDIVLFLVHSKLPLKTKELWDERLSRSDALPKYQRFMDFLESRFRTLESLEATRKVQNISFNSKKSDSKKVSTFQTAKVTSKPTKKLSNPQPQRQTNSCRVCKENFHPLRTCNKFLLLKPEERKSLIMSFGYCFNCFSYSHKLHECTSIGRCSQCGQKHHTLLHLSTSSEDQTLSTPDTIETTSTSIPSTADGRYAVSSVYTHLSETENSVVFPTALIRVSNMEGHSVILRALIDSCSDVSYITKEAAKTLNLVLSETLVEVKGVGDTVSTESRSITAFRMHSLINRNFSSVISAYVLPKISTERPSQNFTVNCEFSNIKLLADPSYNVKSRIDILLGGGVESEIKLAGLIKSKFENINFQETVLGWIVSGSIPTSQCFLTTNCLKYSSANCFLSTNNCQPSLDILQSLDSSLRKFWEVEEIPTDRLLTEEERLSELIYDSTTIRLPSGRYSVSLPFKSKVEGFDGMRKIAFNRFASLERRLTRNESLKQEYSACITEYLDLGHMVEVDPVEFPNAYYIPHHSVVKESSSTTKLRVVFDASAQDSKMASLNSFLLNGPRLQADLLDLLIRFRFFRIGFTADIAKMYRQIIVNPNDYKFQLILWRKHPDDCIRTFALQTVTFGTTAAPYLAIKTLYRLAKDEKSRYPLGAVCLERGFYVDDCIFGADSVEEALEVQSQVVAILKSAGFHLRKWSSSCPILLEAIPESDRETDTLLDFDSKMSVKTLGIQWCPTTDNFMFKISIGEHDVHTKRTVLSDIAKIFDPMGLLSPCIISAKLLIQSLWSESKDWDEPLDSEIEHSWTTLRQGFKVLNNVSIPRWLQTSNECDIEIHGFSDASQTAYAAAIYIKCMSNGKPNVNLLCAKTKVAPLKIISLPRLELMGALLLAKMVSHLKQNYQFNETRTFLWSDSQITLAWIRDDPHKRTVFVANRISEIQSLSNRSDWNYVNTLDNPADLGTRGIPPSLLQLSNLWWNGPEFLKQPSCSYKDQYTQSNENVHLPEDENVKKTKSSSRNPVLHTFLSERRNSVVEVTNNVMKFGTELFNKYSTLSKLVRVVSYCLRFLKQNRKEHLHISPLEYESSLLIIMRMAQLESFEDEIQDLENQRPLKKQSCLYNLHPIIASDNILRVSTRLQLADHLNFDQKFPIILPKNHIISKLVVRHAHLSTFHGTQQETKMLILQRYHIIRCKDLIRFIVNRCVKCFRLRCKAQEQQMGLLPKARVTPNRPFLNCGVDFAGPFELKRFKGRCKQFEKAYFAIFTCFSTKACHLEVVTDLTTSAFVAAYRRFVSRRGLVRNLYSDCGKNFIGAERIVTKAMGEVVRQWNEELAKELSNQFKTSWHFNPPGAPHFGGLWEAGVKSVKYHLKRVVGDLHLTYDEFETILCQIESILNSRPLCKSDQDCSDLVLTPAHFLIQDSLLSLPDDNLESHKISHNNRWTLIQQLLQGFWKLWSYDYLNTERQRKRWVHSKSSIKIDDVVIIKDKNIPPNNWHLGLVIAVHPGPDGLVRVVTLRTKSKEIQRPIVKLCPLPF